MSGSRLGYNSSDLKESVMDTSIGSDGEWSASCISPRSAVTESPTESEKSLDLKFSIANILRPEFGIRRESPSPAGSATDSAFSMPESSGEKMETSCGPSSLDNHGSAASAAAVKAAGAAAAAAAALGLAAQPIVWPAWVYCTRYSDRPSSGPRCRRVKRRKSETAPPVDEKRPRTAFTSEQLNRLRDEFQGNRYLTEKRRQELAHELGLNESQIKIWFQNKRAKIKKQVGVRNPLAFHLMAQGLYNHATIPVAEFDGENTEPSSNANSEM